MTHHSEMIENGLRTAVLVCIMVIIYAGSASAIYLGHIFDDEFFGPTSDADLDVDSYFYPAAVVSILVCVAIPIAAMAFQLSRREDWDRVRY